MYVCPSPRSRNASMSSGADVAADVVPDHLRRLVGSSRRIDAGMRMPVGERRRGALARWARGIGGRSPIASRKVTNSIDRLAARRLTFPLQAQEDQALTVLRNAVAEAVEDPRLDAVAELPQRLVEADQDCAVVPPRKVGDVLDENGRRGQRLDDLDERAPEVGADIMIGALSGFDQLADTSTAGATERLARNPASDRSTCSMPHTPACG